MSMSATLAAAVRRASHLIRPSTRPTITAVTGSSGKTTTASLIHYLLSARHATFLSSHENSAESVFRSFSRLPGDIDHAVFEVSEAEPGSARLVRRILSPENVVLTSARREHWKSFGSFDRLVSEMVDLVPSTAGGIVVLDIDDAVLASLAPALNAHVISVGRHSQATYRGVDERLTAEGHLEFTCATSSESIPISIPLVGRHWVPAVLSALAVACHLGMTLTECAKLLSSFSPVLGRCSPHPTPAGALYICDTLKAPEHSIGSIAQLLDDFAHATRRTVVIGTISDRRPGSARKSYRRALNELLPRAERVFFFGPGAAHTRIPPDAEATGKIRFVKDIRELDDALGPDIPGEVVVLKGTLSMDHLERIALHRQSAIQCFSTTCRRINGGRGCFPCEDLRQLPGTGALVADLTVLS